MNDSKPKKQNFKIKTHNPKIAFFAQGDFPEGRGENSRIKSFLKGLKANNFEIELLFINPSNYNSGFNTQNKGIYKGVPFWYINGSCRRSKSSFLKFLNSLKSIFKSSYFILKNHKKYDLFFINNPSFLFYFHIYFLLKILKKKLVIEQSELSSTIKTNKLKYKLFSITNRIDERFAHYFVSHIFVISTKLYRHYSRYFKPSRISIIPIMIDFERFKDVDISQQTNTIGYFGSFGSKDGVGGIIRAFGKAAEKNKNLKLNLMGMGAASVNLNNILNEQTAKNVTLINEVRYENIPKILSRCDLLILNRTNHIFSHFGFPLKLGEYLATGRPTICTKVGDIELFLKHEKTSFLINPDNVEELTKAILKRYREYDLFNQIGLNGRELCKKHFNFERRKTKILKALTND